MTTSSCWADRSGCSSVFGAWPFWPSAARADLSTVRAKAPEATSQTSTSPPDCTTPALRLVLREPRAKSSVALSSSEDSSLGSLHPALEALEAGRALDKYLF